MPLKDLEKLTVVKLRAELIARGLDSKGNKPFLLERLRSAIQLEEENGCLPPEITTHPCDDQNPNTSMEQEEYEEDLLKEDPAADAVNMTASNGTSEVNNGSHPAALVDTTEKPESPSTAVQPESDEFSFSNSAQNDSISAVYGGKNETFMEDSSLDQSLDSSTPLSGNTEKIVNKAETFPTVHEEAETLNGKDEQTDNLSVEKRQENIPELGLEKVDEAADALEMDVSKTEEEKDADDKNENLTETELLMDRCIEQNNLEKDEVAAADELVKTEEMVTKDNELESGASKMEEEKIDETDRGTKRPRDRSATPSAVQRSDVPPPEDEPEWDQNLVLLDWYNSDLNLTIQKSDFLSAGPLTDGGFAYMWAGARATYGFSKGRVCYEVKVIEHLSVPHMEASETDPHVVRVGWSLDTTSLQLGEEAFSYGFGGKGKISEDCKFNDYGAPFQLNDVVGVYMDASEDKEKVELSFTVNGTAHGVAFSIAKEDLKERALFPHILSKNCKFEVNFGDKEEPWFQPVEGFEWASKLALEDRVRGTRAPASKADCKMIMMCGLPGSGKTTWANKFCSENIEHKYNILGTNAFLDKMKVNGLSRRKNYSGRWEALIEKCTRCLNILLEIAAKRRRNYILDQTNVYPTAQKRKMAFFNGFQRKAVVIVPTDEEAKVRTEKRIREEGKDVPDSAVMEMKANFKIPSVDDTFSEVEFPELQLEEALKVIEKYSTEAKAAGYGQPPTKKARQQSQNYAGNRNMKSNERDNRHGSGRDSRSRDSRGSQGHRYSSSRSYRDSRDDRSRPLPPPSGWRGGSGALNRGGGGMGRGGWSGNRGPPMPLPSRNGPYSPRRGPPPPPGRGGWSGSPSDRSYQGMRSSGSGGGRNYDDRRNERPSYSSTRRDAPSPWINQSSSSSMSSTPQRAPWSPNPQSWGGSHSSSSYGQQSYGNSGAAASYGGSASYGSSGGAGRFNSYSTGSTRPSGYSPSSGSSRPSSYSSNGGPSRPTSYGHSMPNRPSSYASTGGSSARSNNYGTNGSANSWTQQQQTGYQQYPYNPQNHSAYSGGK